MVDNGFCIIHGNINKDISLLAHSCSGNIEMLRNGCLFTGRKTPVQSYRFATGSAYLIGSLRNKRLLRHLATHFTGGVPVVNGAEVLYQLSTQLGSAALGLAEGDFCFFIEDRNGTLTLLTDARGQNPVYLVNAGDRWITDKLKLISALHDRDIQHDPQGSETAPSVGCHIQRILPGTLNVFRFSNADCEVCESRQLLRPAKMPLSIEGGIQ
ncbi:Carbapenam-3-carboxylate synthase [Sodalis praecaptivus]|uniref:carbapenam-3-carboxylate synthase domain-containing protein n=1 Tax=Sodalis praecaptivus TaxID=1239307 RepID=UPI0027EEC3F7|nr:carbapenam-3-carboxylate synthase domain-containing protein [Sodalis praecaptivus]CAJ0999108.1 Carbapenam-3-carboxylate synthase [Sodalis praecaptivus]